jgi:RNA-directed DNA polymerase
MKGRDWVFACDTTSLRGKPITLSLFRAADVKIVRHVRIKSEANPFDPSYDQYFEDRKRALMVRRLEDREFHLGLWRRQDGVCPGCGLSIGAEDRWHVHHKVRRAHGGSDISTNLELRHPNCHRKIHARLPAPIEGAV